MAEPPSSPPSESTNPEDALAWYKNQYAQLEVELADFRESSHELEKELEKDVEQAEKRERVLQEKADSLNYEVDEWKRKYRESKSEAASAQSTLEREITTLRDSNRTLTLKLRDIEVANDDFERQARNTTSSLEDMESKYNVSIERGVMLEEEIKMGEQEREKLRIESQRLKEELSDLKIEAEVLQDKIRKHESRHLSLISTDVSVPESPTFDKSMADSPRSTASSPLITTPPAVADLSSSKANGPTMQGPPSPPMSDASAPLPKQKTASSKTPGVVGSAQRKSRLPSADSSVTPKPRTSNVGSSTGARKSGTRAATNTAPLRTPANRTGIRSTSQKLPTSNSLSHVRSLTAQMQRLEARVQSVRSKLPAPVSTPPRASPRSSVNGGIPSTVTIRSRKRAPGSTASSAAAGDDTTPTNAGHVKRTSTATAAAGTKHMPRLSTSGISRLSFGPLPNRNPGGGVDSDHSMSRPGSRASVSSFARPASRSEMAPPRPMSRASLSGARTPLGRPRSSLGGSMHRASVGNFEAFEDAGGSGGGCADDDGEFRTPSRRGTYYKLDGDNGASGIPAPATGIPMPNSRRQSSGGARRISSGVYNSKMSDLDETY